MSSDPRRLIGSADPPWFGVLEGDTRLVDQRRLQWSEEGFTVRCLRGRLMRTEKRSLDQLAAALQFPLYFGRNWDALQDCLTDLQWLPTIAGYVLVIADASEVLADEPASLSTLVDVLRTASERWADPDIEAEWWEHAQGIAFTVLLQADPRVSEAVRHRWQDAGAIFGS